MQQFLTHIWVPVIKLKKSLICSSYLLIYQQINIQRKRVTFEGRVSEQVQVSGKFWEVCVLQCAHTHRATVIHFPNLTSLFLRFSILYSITICAFKKPSVRDLSAAHWCTHRYCCTLELLAQITVHGQCWGFQERNWSRSLGTGLLIMGPKVETLLKLKFYLFTVTLSISTLFWQDDGGAECYTGWLVSWSWLIIISRQRKTLIARLAVTGRQGLSGRGSEGITRRGHGPVEFSSCHAAWITAGLFGLCVTVWCGLVWDMHRASRLIIASFRDTGLQWLIWRNECLYLWLFWYGKLL